VILRRGVNVVTGVFETGREGVVNVILCSASEALVISPSISPSETGSVELRMPAVVRYLVW
jgi:hypothetical protein